MLMRLFVMVLILMVPSMAQATTLYSDTFDTYGNLSATVSALQARYVCSYSSSIAFTDGAAQDVDSAQAFSSPYSIKQHYAGTQYDNPPQGGGSCEFDYTDQTQRNIWITWYHKFGTGFVTGGGPGVSNAVATKGLYMYMRSPSTGRVHGWVWHYFYGGRQLTLSAQGIKDHKGPNGPGTGTAIPYDTENMWQNIQAFAEPDNQWTCYEANFKLNTPGAADGQYLLYVTPQGGQTFLSTSITNREFVDSNNSGQMPGDSAWFRFKFYRQDGSGDMWYDNTAVTTTRLGCSGTPPAGDTTAPSQVTGLSSPTKTSSTVNLSWTAATDNVGVVNYIVQSCTGAACTNFGTIGTSIGTTFTHTGRAASTLYRYRVAAQDAATNVGTYSSIVDVTTSAATSLPTVTAFTTTSAGGTITYTGSPTSFRIAFGGNTGTSSEVILTAAQVPSGVLTFAWPAGTTWACAHARDAMDAEDPIEYRCNSVVASTGGALRQHSTNGRWFTDDSGNALLLAGMSGTLTLPNATRSALQDFTVTAPTDGFARANNADLGASWDPSYTEGTSFKIANNGVECSVTITDACLEAYTGTLDNNQAAEVLLRTWNPGSDETLAQVLLRMAAPPTATYYRFMAAANNTGSVTCTIEKSVAGVATTLATSTSPGWGAGDILRATANGTTLTLYRNGVPILTTTDASIAGGKAGLFIYTAAASTSAVVLDEFYAWNLADADPTVNDYVTAFDGLVSSGLNYARMWITPDVTSWGEAAWYATGGEPRVSTLQLPWLRTGVSTNCTTGTCVMVGRYNLDAFNENFFTQVRQRVLAARARGIKLSVMLFEAWGANFTTYHAFSSPFASGNNEQGLSCDANANGRCEELHTLSNVNITPYQRAYVRKMVDTLGDLDNIWWEIVNEPVQAGSQAWQEDMAATIRAYEATKGYSHLIMQGPYVSPPTSSNSYLRASGFTVIQPSCLTAENYDTNPPVSNGVKIEMYDTDHTGESDMCGTEVSGWPWKTFLRGRHPVLLGERESAGVITQLKAEMAQTVSYANKVNLAAMTPRGDTAIFSTAYGMDNTCNEYLMYMPTDGSSTINLTSCGTGATFTVEYLNVTSGVTTSGGTVNGGASRSFNPAGSDPMVVYLKSFVPADITPPLLSGGSPQGVLAAGTTSVSMQVTTDENATCKYSLTDVAYGSMASTFGTTGTTAHSQTISGLTNGNTYTYYSRCQDVAGNANTSSYVITWSVTALAPDVAPPVRTAGSPSGVLVDSTTSTTLSLTTDENATCKYGTVAGTAYASIANTFGTTGTTSHSQTLTGLTAGTTYNYYVRCIDGSANANMTDYAIPFQIAAPTDTAAPILSGGGPSTIQPAGTTSVSLTVTTNKNATCKFDSTIGTAYASMGTTFGTTGGLVHTHSLSGLSDGTSYVKYVRCIGAVSGVATTTDYVIGFSVASAAAGYPADVMNVRGTSQNSQTAIFWQWDAATNADHYIIEISLGGSFVSAIETANASTFYLQTGLSYGSYNARVKAVNTDGVTSTNWGSSLPVNVVLPPTLTGVQAVAYSNSVVLSWNAVSDTGLVAIFERCTGAACTSFDLPRGVSATSFVDNTVSPGTTYGYRGVWSNPTLGGTSTTWSTTVYVTTTAAAASPNDLTRARIQVPFGSPRLPRN